MRAPTHSAMKMLLLLVVLGPALAIHVEDEFLARGKMGGRAKTLATLGYIGDPVPVGLEEMRNVDTTGMQVNHFDGKQKLYRYPLNEDEIVSGAVANTGTFDNDQVNKLCAAFDDTIGPANFLDVGANIGTYSIAMAECLKKRGHGGKVISVEGMPKTAHYLEASVVANELQDYVDVYNYAVSDGEMSADIVEMNLEPKNAAASSIVGKNRRALNGNGYWRQYVHDGKTVETKVTTLDSILVRDGRKPNIFAMKMDIEGSEGHALQGAKEFLSKATPCILLIELMTDWLNKAGTPEESVLQLLRNYGFDTPTTLEHKYDFQNFDFRQKDFGKCLSKFAK